MALTFAPAIRRAGPRPPLTALATLPSRRHRFSGRALRETLPVDTSKRNFYLPTTSSSWPCWIVNLSTRPRYNYRFSRVGHFGGAPRIALTSSEPFSLEQPTDNHRFSSCRTPWRRTVLCSHFEQPVFPAPQFQSLRHVAVNTMRLLVSLPCIRFGSPCVLRVIPD